MSKVRDRGVVEADLTIRCESPSIVLTRLHGRPYGRPTGGTSGAGGLCVGLCPLPHKEDQCILSNNSSVRHLTAGSVRIGHDKRCFSFTTTFRLKTC